MIVTFGIANASVVIIGNDIGAANILKLPVHFVVGFTIAEEIVKYIFMKNMVNESCL